MLKYKIPQIVTLTRVSPDFGNNEKTTGEVIQALPVVLCWYSLI